MSAQDAFFLVALGTTVVLAFLTGVYFQRKEKGTLAGFCALGCIIAIACAFFLREKSGNGELIEINNLPLKTHWRVLVKVPLKERYGTIIKNSATGKIISFSSKEEPPAEFVVEKKGIPGLRKKTMTPIESNGYGKEKEKK